VKYLASSVSDRWVNEHAVRVNDSVDAYAIVFYQSLLPVALVMFDARRLGEIGAALQKRHSSQSSTLLVTRANYVRLVSERHVFGPLGVRVWTAPAWQDLT
jgi:hypothetical protein